MASGIPTRRTTRRVDENAPPAASGATRSRSTATVATSDNTASTSIPVMKRASSALGTTSTRAATTTSTAGEPKPAGSTTSTASKPAARRRPALGEIGASTGENKTDKGKVAASATERRPLASRQTSQVNLRRNTRSTSTLDDKPAAAATKRKAGTTARARPGFSRGASAASVASTSTSTSTTVRPSRQLKETASLTETGPAPKRFRQSTPEDVFIDEQYDEDNKELDVAPVDDASGSASAGNNAEPSTAVIPKDFGWTDLDAEDEDDPTMVPEYVVEAFEYMFEQEKATLADPKYMDKQDELQWKMRTILNDWIIEVHSKFRLLPETLLIATNLIDRFLSKRTVSLVKFQLVGLTSLFVASKYEEVICPGVTHFLHMTDGGYDVGEILRAERYLLQTLDFDLSYPNPLHFLRRVSKADGYDVHCRTVAKFFIEVSCVEHRLLPFPPSMLAAAAMWIARLCLGRGPWHANMVHYSGYAQHEVLPAAQVMIDYIVNPDLDICSAFFKKYASRKHLKASVFVRDWATHRWAESHKGISKVQGRELEDEFGGVRQAPPPCAP